MSQQKTCEFKYLEYPISRAGMKGLENERKRFRYNFVWNNLDILIIKYPVVNSNKIQ